MDELIRHPLTHLRIERGWTLEDLARRIRRAAGRHGLRSGTTRQLVWRWEHGRAVPDDFSQSLLADVFGVEAAEVARLGWPHWLPAHDAPVPLGPHSTLTAVWEAISTVDRRSFATFAGGALVGLAQQWATLEPWRLAGASSGRHVDPELLAWLEASTSQLATLATAQRQHVVPLLDAHLATLAGLLRDARYGEETGRRLAGLVARTGQTIGWHRFDQGRHSAATRHWHAALHSAHAAADRELGAGILADLAYQAIWLEQPRTAIDILTHAASRARHATSRSLLSLRRARAHALLGEGAACRGDLAAAERSLSAASGLTSPGWCEWMSASDLAVDTGRCLLDLGELRAGHVHIAEGVGQLPSSRAKSSAVFLAYQADGHLRSGEVEQAADAAGRSLRLARDVGAERCLALVGELLPRFADRGAAPGVAELMALASETTARA